jgi:hypothetical protein
MPETISLKKVEKQAFTSIHNDGLWDIFLGCFLLMFAIAPFLSTSMGDFWSSAVFLPFWGLIYLMIRWVRKHVVAPRVGTARFGRARLAKLRKFSTGMLIANVIALVLGILAARSAGVVSGQTHTILAGLVFLVGFSAAAYFLDFFRLYLYGLLIGLSPVVGEWLWAHNKAPHHGFPVTFGFTALVAIVVGVVLFVRLVRGNPIPVEELHSEEA